jgi:S-adenosylmethionine decarboxylase proenzyme
MMDTLARHLLAEYYGCDPRQLDDPQRLAPLLEAAVEAGRATVIRTLLHRFGPQGVSGVVILAESHLAVHTWPEHAFATVEVLVCGAGPDPEASHRFLLQRLRPARHELRVLGRGDPALIAQTTRRPPDARS